MRNFIKDYILSQVQQTQQGTDIQKINTYSSTSQNFGYEYVQCGEYTVFYENLSDDVGMKFYIYDNNMKLIKTEHLTDNWIAISGKTLKQDEDGNFYLVGYMNPSETAQGTTYYSLILLNNIIKNTSEIRKWYKLSDIGITTVLDCQKRNGSADYLFTWETTRTVSGNTVYDLNFTQFTISVQNGNSHNLWILKNYSTQLGRLLLGYQYNLDSSKILAIKRESNKMIVNLINIDNDWQTNTVNELTIENGVEVSKTINEVCKNSFGVDSLVINGISSFVYITNDSNEIVSYKINDNYNSSIRKPLNQAEYLSVILTTQFILYITGSSLFYFAKIYKYELQENDIVIQAKNISFQPSYTDNFSSINDIYLINSNVFNLSYFVIGLIGIDGTGTVDIIVTDNSTLVYQDFDSLVPNYANIMDLNKISFSRKVINKTIIGNQMSAEVNIPYSMLNRSFTIEKLISNTYKMLATETKIIRKNIYESLYLNFIKHINVIDNNFEKNELQNEISSLLTKSVFDLPQENYDKAPIGYAKIFSTDGRELIISIGQNAIRQINQFKYEISIAINGNNAEKIQILAKDKQTVYVTIPLFKVNRVILLKQILKIEEE